MRSKVTNAPIEDYMIVANRLALILGAEIIPVNRVDGFLMYIVRKPGNPTKYCYNTEQLSELLCKLP